MRQRAADPLDRGPCVIESHDLTLLIADRLRTYSDQLGFPLNFKASFDKANRSSRQIVPRARLAGRARPSIRFDNDSDVPVTTDIHECHQAEAVAQVCEVLQVPAFLCPADRPGSQPRRNRADDQCEEGSVHGPVGHEKCRFQDG